MRDEVWSDLGRNTVTGLSLQDSSPFLPAFYLSLSLSLLEDLSDFTDENGTVTFEVPARPYTASVSAQNFLPDSQSIPVGLGESRSPREKNQNKASETVYPEASL